MSFLDPGSSGRTRSGMPSNPWRTAWQKASYGGAQFFVERDSVASGRRVALHEYPKKDIPFAEDMGKRASRHIIQGYVIGPYFVAARNRLQDQLEQKGAKMLVHPLLKRMMVICDGYAVVESNDRGGMATFDMSFIEAGEAANTNVFENTSAAVNTTANAADTATVATVNSRVPTPTKPFVSWIV